MEVYETDHKMNVEHHVRIWDTIKHAEFGNVHVSVCTEIASSLVILRNFNLLDLFLKEVGPARVIELQRNEKFLRAFIAYKLHFNQYTDVYSVLEVSRGEEILCVLSVQSNDSYLLILKFVFVTPLPAHMHVRPMHWEC